MVHDHHYMYQSTTITGISACTSHYYQCQYMYQSTTISIICTGVSYCTSLSLSVTFALVSDTGQSTTISTICTGVSYCTGVNTCSTSLLLSVSLALVSDDVPVYCCQSHWCQTMYQSAAVGVTGVSTCTTTSLLL